MSVNRIVTVLVDFRTCRLMLRMIVLCRESFTNGAPVPTGRVDAGRISLAPSVGGGYRATMDV